jgi:exopolysaccharide production protein ExoQ
MPPKLAFAIGLLLVGFMYAWVERRRTANVSSALFWPLLWYVLTASRSVAVWFYCLGIPLPNGTENEGNIIDRSVYFFLCLIGIAVLLKRNINWESLRRENKWLMLLLVFMFLSVVWSDYNWISFKRAVKSFAAVTMALVVLTDKDPIEAIETLIRRGAYLLIPLSIIVIKYFRSIGVQYDWAGTGASWCGLSTSKNTLGQIVMISALYFSWAIFRDFKKGRPEAKYDYLYLAMCMYLLRGSERAVSLTSLAVFVLGLLLFTTCYRNRNNTRFLSRLLTVASVSILCVQAILLVHTANPYSNGSPLGLLIRSLGRDITLSGRTGIWSDVLNIANRSPFFGVGFGGFWIGRVANIPWDANLSWVLGEGHNGYLDTYLQIGIVGLFMLLGVIFSSRRRIAECFAWDFEYGMFRMTFLIIILLVNATESTFLRGEHMLWFMFLICVISIPQPLYVPLAESEFEVPDDIVPAEPA